MAHVQTSFQDRLKSIADPRNTFYVDPETGTFVPKRVSKKQIKQGIALKKIKKPGVAGFTGSLILGAMCLMGARYLRFNHLGMQDGAATADVMMAIDKDVRVQDDAIASVRSTGIIGDKFVKITPGGSDVYLQPGESLVDTEPSISLEELISKYIFEGKQ